MKALTLCGCIFLIFLVSAGGCSEKNIVTVNEITKDRTHQFEYAYDGEHILLDGSLSVDNEMHPVQIYYDKDKAVLVRKASKECIIFDKTKVLFGFVPFDVAVDHYRNPESIVKVSVEAWDGEIPLAYSIDNTEGRDVERSSVVFATLVRSEVIELDTSTCISETEYVLNV